MNKQIIKITICSAICVLANLLQAGVGYGSVVRGDEPELYVDRFGMGQPTVISNGYLFIEFEYVPPPYRIQRIGQAIIVNGVIANRLFNGEPPIVNGERKYGYTEDNIKPALALYESMFSDPLLRGGEAVFLCKEGYESRRFDHMKEASKMLKVPIFEKIRADVIQQVIQNILTNQLLESTNEIEKIKENFSRLNAEDIRLFIRNARKCPELAERIRTEIALSETQKQPAGSSYARLISDLEVVSATGYGWKLTVLFDNGLEFYVGRDMEIRNILFATNAITVEAYRDDLRFPLPTTKRIRVAPKLQTTLKSCKTGQTCTATITDSLDNAISMDDLKYQVVDIRPSTQTVLLKNCKTGERIIVSPQKRGTGEELK